jgi:carboxylate-amine ligase
MKELARLRQIAENGTSATRQRRIHAEAAAKDEDPGKAVVRHLIEEFHADL